MTMADPPPEQSSPTIQQALDLALKHHQAGQLAQAEGIYRSILRIEPDHPVALHLLGVLAHQLGKHAQAVDLIKQALTIEPDFADAHYNLGLALRALGKPNDAVASYRNVLAIRPDYAKAHNNLCNTLRELGNLEEGVSCGKKALAINAEYPEAHYNLGNAQKDLGKTGEAAASYHRALKIKPDYAEAYVNLGIVFKEQGRLEEAGASYHKALSIRPDFVEACVNLGTLFKEEDRLEEAVAINRKALAIRPGFAEAHSNLVYTMQFQTGVTLQEIGAAHGEWDRHHGLALQDQWCAHDTVPDRERRLRIGFVSPDLGRHPVGYFIGRLLQDRQKNDAAFVCYSDAKPDDLTEHLKASCDEWMGVRGVSDAALSARIRSDKIDILIDLAGHTARNRLLVFARKPAPIQVT